MPDKLWKATERRIAKIIGDGAQRNSLSGMNAKITAGDIIHDKFYVEVKERVKIPFYKVFRDVQINAKKEHKIPIMVIHQKNSKDDILIMTLKDFKALNDGGMHDE